MILRGRGADMAQHRGGFKVKLAAPLRVPKIPLNGMIRFDVFRLRAIVAWPAENPFPCAAMML